MVINGSTIYNNAVGTASFYLTTAITNCTFIGNGQAINAIGTAIRITNCTIVGNTYGFSTNNLKVTRKNTISIDPPYTGFNTYFTDLGNNITSGNPGLGPVANNCGPTLTMMPLTGSPAIDGDKNSAP